ncbi:hypothetical protein HA396_28335, partial [Escherichia coli]|nr:hypothetical protein [Escherichia coli]
VIFREDLEAIFGKRAWDPELTETPVSSLEEVKKYDEPVVIENDEENKG